MKASKTSLDYYDGICSKQNNNEILSRTCLLDENFIITFSRSLLSFDVNVYFDAIVHFSLALLSFVIYLQYSVGKSFHSYYLLRSHAICSMIQSFH